MTQEQHYYLTDDWRSSHMSLARYEDVGVECYENGWIDDFGIVTPKGHKAIEEYESSR